MSKIKIGGAIIDEQYLITTKAWAQDFAQKLGLADAYRHDKLTEIDLRNRVITLCQNFISQNIRKWLDVVYFDDPLTISKFTSSYNARRRKGSSDQTTPEPENVPQTATALS